MLVFRELVTRDDTWIRARANKYRILLCRTSLYTIITKGAPQGPGPLLRKCLIRVRNVVTMNTGMLHEEATIRTTASTLKKYYVGKSLRLVCGPVCVSASGHAILADNAVEALADEILLFTTLIMPNSFFRTNRRSRSRAWQIWSLYQGNSSPSVQKRPHSKGGLRDDNDDGSPRAAIDESCDFGMQAWNFRREYEYSPVGCSEEDLISQLVH
jgi:hypothetical protein